MADAITIWRKRFCITFVEPYLDLQTKTVMMTVSERMSDGESVLAMYISKKSEGNCLTFST